VTGSRDTIGNEDTVNKPLTISSVGSNASEDAANDKLIFTLS